MSKPSSSPETLGEKMLTGPTNRREFFRFTGLSAAAAALIMPGCQQLGDFIDEPTAVQAKNAHDLIDLGSGDIGILNYAYALEQLEAAFYTQVVATPYRNINQDESMIMRDLKAHESIHRDFLKLALGAAAIPMLTFNFSSIDFRNRQSVLRAAQTFEDLGVSAYNGAGQLLENPAFLLVAGKIVSVEARHASIIRTRLQKFSFADTTDKNGLDPARLPSEVAPLAQAFIQESLSIANLPTV
ncbi:hypothetical protein BH24BAC1_BH24BAC1_34350 [soil metagenome]